MSVALSRPIAARHAEAPKSARPWIVHALLPLAAFVVVPLTTPYLAADATGLLGTGVAWNAATFVLVTTLLLATATDLAHRKIRNYLTYTACLWLIGLSIAATQFGPSSNAPAWLRQSLAGTLPPAQALAGAAACFAAMFFVFVLSGAGGGDVKVCTVIGAALGAELGLTAVVVSHIAAGAAALGWLVLRHGPISTAVVIGRTIGSFLMPIWIMPPKRESAAWLKFPMPMSPFFLIGTVTTLLALR